MDFFEMIKTGATKAGSQAKLAIAIGETAPGISNALKGKRGIPDDSCAKLAELISVDFGTVIAARNLALAKDKTQRDFWLPFVRQAVMTVATITISSGAVLSDSDHSECWRRGWDSNPRMPCDIA